MTPSEKLVSAADWPQDCHAGLETAIASFRSALPGWWYTIGECQVSCDASCAPTGLSGDVALIPIDGRFDSGFHVDLAQPSTLAMALATVQAEALEARLLALSDRSREI